MSALIELPELEVESFAGLGGAAFGIEAATQRPVALALNHSQHAIAQHWVLHPRTHHLLQDVWKVDPRHVCAGRRVGLFWASPDCTHFSRAKGGKPVSRKVRGLAWAVVRWAKTVRPRIMIVENVEEFTTWGPLLEDDTPDPARRCMYFRRWVRQLERLGYTVEWKSVAAHDYGAPTTRSRLFVIARCDGRPIVWPLPSHGPGRASPHRPMSEVIDWSLPMLSVYDRLAPKTIARIDRGIDQFVTGLGGPTFVHRVDGHPVAAFIAQHNGGQTGKPLTVPLPTITTRDRHALVTVGVVKSDAGPVHLEGQRWAVGEVGHRMLAPVELAGAMGFPSGIELIGTKEKQSAGIGNAVSPRIAVALVAANYQPDQASAS